VVDELLGDVSKLAAMRAAMKRLAKPDAASRIVDRLLALTGR
jgi:UDP-N-acetylglucosamine:LPS N-acetylglucosamine transferase